MDANAMKNEFLVLYDKVTSSSAPGYTNAEISIFLSKAQESIIDEAFDSQKERSSQETEKRRREFDELIRAATPTPSATQTYAHPNGVFFDLPSDFLYAMSEEVTTSSSDACNSGVRVRVKPITEDEYAATIRNPLKKPYVSGGNGLVWRMDFSAATAGTKRVELITDSTFTVGTYHLRYLKQPVDIVPYDSTDTSTSAQVDCEMPIPVHRSIVERAVRIATGVTNPQEYQIKLNEENLNQ